MMHDKKIIMGSYTLCVRVRYKKKVKSKNKCENNSVSLRM